MADWTKIFGLDNHRSEDLKNKAALLNLKYSNADQFGLVKQLSEFQLIKPKWCSWVKT